MTVTSLPHLLLFEILKKQYWHGIFNKLRHDMSLVHLKQLSYNLVHSFISYASVAWGSLKLKSTNKKQ